MKRLVYSLFALLFVLVYSGCSNNDSAGTGTDPFGGGTPGGGTGNVTCTVALVQNNQNQRYFEFKPSAGVIVQRMTAKCVALNLNDVVEDAAIPDDVFSSTVPLYVGPITAALATGQAWTFTISGKVGSTQGAAFSATINYSIP